MTTAAREVEIAKGDVAEAAYWWCLMLRDPSQHATRVAHGYPAGSLSERVAWKATWRTFAPLWAPVPQTARLLNSPTVDVDRRAGARENVDTTTLPQMPEDWRAAALLFAENTQFLGHPVTAYPLAQQLEIVWWMCAQMNQRRQAEARATVKKEIGQHLDSRATRAGKVPK